MQESCSKKSSPTHSPNGGVLSGLSEPTPALSDVATSTAQPSAGRASSSTSSSSSALQDSSSATSSAVQDSSSVPTRPGKLLKKSAAKAKRSVDQYLLVYHSQLYTSYDSFCFVSHRNLFQSFQSRSNNRNHIIRFLKITLNLLPILSKINTILLSRLLTGHTPYTNLQPILLSRLLFCCMSYTIRTKIFLAGHFYSQPVIFILSRSFFQ